MVPINIKIPRIRRVTTWKTLIYLTILGLTIYFIAHERANFFKIKTELGKANPLWIYVGFVFTLFYVLLQSSMYYFSFKTLNKKITFSSSIILFLKRNFLSIFLPAGGISSLVFFNKEIEKQNISKTQIYLASSMYAFCGLLSVLLIAIPTFIYLLLYKSISKNELIGLIILLGITAFAAYLIYSFIKGTFIHKLIERYVPQISTIFQELKEQKFKPLNFVITGMFSVFVDMTGVFFIIISMMALGMNFSFEVAFVAYVVMVILLVASPLIRGLGAIEVSMSYVFISYGQSPALAISTTLLFRLFEFWSPLFLGIFSFIANKRNVILRIAPSVFLFTLGIINIISVITPKIPERFDVLLDFIPLEAANASHFLILVSGVITLIVSVYLIRGTRNAWVLALFLSVISFVGHLTKALDYEEASFALLTTIVLIYTRKNYFVRSDLRLWKFGYKTFIIVFGCAILYGTIGFYLLDIKHFGIDFSLKKSLIEVIKLFFMFNTSNLHPLTVFGRYFIHSLYFCGAASLCVLAYSIAKPFVYKSEATTEEIDLANKSILKNGKSSLDYFKTYYDKKIFFTKDKSSFVSFKVANNFAIALENPVCKNDEAMYKAIDEFDSYTYENGLKSIYYRVPEESLKIYKSFNKKSLLIGQEAVVDLNSFSLHGNDMKSLRHAVNKSTESGYKAVVYEPTQKDGLLQKLKLVSDEWLDENKMEESLFSEGAFDWQLVKNHTIITFENVEEKIFAFMSIIPDYNPSEATYDLQRKFTDSPNGCLDFLMIKMLEYLKSKKYQKVNIGLAPMSGIDETKNFPEKAMKYAYENIQSFAHFRGLRSNKQKFNPEWHNKYLIYENDYDLFRIPLAISNISKK
ncbi:MAG: phosphatidylglycerol lysyltransferase domain-containing protein [Bacteroidales bacterium]|jgi:phosphatidylglycerol lysyltransferase